MKCPNFLLPRAVIRCIGCIEIAALRMSGVDEGGFTTGNLRVSSCRQAEGCVESCAVGRRRFQLCTACTRAERKPRVFRKYMSGPRLHELFNWLRFRLRVFGDWLRPVDCPRQEAKKQLRVGHLRSGFGHKYSRQSSSSKHVGTCVEHKPSDRPWKTADSFRIDFLRLSLHRTC